MKSTMKAILVAVAIFGMTAGASVQAQGVKIAVVDVGAIFQQLPQREEIAQALQREFGDRIERMQSLEQELNSMQERARRDEAIMSESEREAFFAEFQGKMQDAQERGEQLNQDMRRRQNEERDRLLRRIQQVVASIADAEGYDVVLEGSSVAYARQSFDISEAVVERMSRN